MAHTYDFVALGDPVLDLVIRSPQLPRWDDKHLGQTAQWTSGGSEANAACAAATFGLRCALVGHAGQGPGASLHRQDLSRRGVSIEHLTSDDGRDGAMAVVYVSPDGERAITYVPAGGAADANGGETASTTRSIPSASPSAADQALPAAWARAAGLARMLFTLPYNAGWLLSLAAQAQAHQSRLAVDVERAVLDQHGMRDALCVAPHVLCFNAAGFRAFTGGTEIQCRNLLHVMTQVKAEAIVVTLGPEGALGLARGGTVVHQPALPARVVDTTGAGDAFNGAWLAGWLKGQTMAEALPQAVTLAGRCIEHSGPRSYLDHMRAAEDSRPVDRAAVPASSTAHAAQSAARRTPS